MIKKQLRIWFTDFWPNFDFENNIFTDLLNDKYEVLLDEHNPDFLFFSVFGYNHVNYNCVRIFFTGENVAPDHSICDYSFSFAMAKGNDRHYRLPHYYQFGNMDDLLEDIDYEKIAKEKTKFCNFIFSNPACKKRNDFFKKLSKYKKVDSAGRFMNNMDHRLGMRVEDKWEFMKSYKFSICFENEEADYYTTEKPFEAMKLNNIPIYWGNSKVDIDFNKEAMLLWYDYGSDEALIEKIIELDQNEDKYIEFLKQSWFKNNELNEYVKRENILAQIDKIVNTEIVPVSATSCRFSDNKFKQNMGLFRARLRYKKFVISRAIHFFSWKKVQLKLEKIKKNQKW